MTLFVLGAGGHMGTAFARAAHDRKVDTVLLSHAQCDVRDERALESALADAHAGDVVVNAAALLGTLEAERRPQPQLEINVRGAMQAAVAARRSGAAIVHFGTDYVFDGAKNTPYVESDAPNPINMYGALKLASEVLVRRANQRGYVLRIASVFGRGTSKAKPNFVDRMLSAARTAPSVAVDEVLMMSPTYALDAANVALDLIARDAPYGVYHAANAGACSWYEFATAIFELAGIDCRVMPREASDGVPRPANASLKSERLPELGITVRPWRDALAAYLNEGRSR